VSKRRTGGSGVIAGLAAIAAVLTACPSAGASLPHVVAPGETLWSIAAANNLTTRTVAVYNGLPEDASLVEGTTIDVPTVDEGAAALATAPAPAPPASGSVSADTGEITPAPEMGHIPSPYGDLHLAPAAAESWNAMRAESLELYGVDLHPGGVLSAYRTYEQQAGLYEEYLAGAGAPANPPGMSSHELGTAVDVATPEMRWVIDQIGWRYGWSKVHGPGEWWHVDYVGG
jgi:LAS superfamily LD-carboxypeptidase LdcB